MMRFLIILLLVGCSNFRTSPAKKVTSKKVIPVAESRDKILKKYAVKTVSREGQFSTSTEGDITTEFYRRENGETILTLEKGELRTEVEKKNSGLMLTRTWQEGKMTTLTLSGTKRTTLVVFDGDGKFTQKIVTEKGKDEAACFQYQAGKPRQIEAENCLELISSF